VELPLEFVPGPLLAASFLPPRLSGEEAAMSPLLLPAPALSTIFTFLDPSTLHSFGFLVCRTIRMTAVRDKKVKEIRRRHNIPFLKAHRKYLLQGGQASRLRFAAATEVGGGKIGLEHFTLRNGRKQQCLAYDWANEAVWARFLAGIDAEAARRAAGDDGSGEPAAHAGAAGGGGAAAAAGGGGGFGRLPLSRCPPRALERLSRLLSDVELAQLGACSASLWKALRGVPVVKQRLGIRAAEYRKSQPQQKLKKKKHKQVSTKRSKDAPPR